jgi:hypothetical protein
MAVCPHCGNAVGERAKFCNKCGEPFAGTGAGCLKPPAPQKELPPRDFRRAAAEQASVRSRELPPREIARRVREPGAGTIAALAFGSKVAGLGGLVVLAGCFLPLASGVAENTSIIPALTKETAYALLVPLSALALAAMAWSAASAPPQSRAMLGGSVIALGSPWAVLCILLILAATKAISALGEWGLGGGGVGAGVFALAAGFVAAVVGGFIMLREAVTS